MDTPPELTPQRRRVLRAVADHDAPVTLVELVEELGGHPNTTRQQLTALTADGLLSAGLVARPGSGRRPTGWTATPAGRRALVDVGQEDHRQLLRATAAYLSQTGASADDAADIGRIWARDLVETGDTPDRAWDAVVEVMAERGFEPRPTGEDEVVLTGCPLLATANEFPGIVCPIHRGLAEEVLARRGRDVDVELLPHAHPDGCVLRVAPPTD